MTGRHRRNVRLVRILGMTRAGYDAFDIADLFDLSERRARGLRALATIHHDAIVAMLRDGTERSATIAPRRSP